MRFQFEYTPIKFKKFVREHFGYDNLLPYPEYGELHDAAVVELRKQIRIKAGQPMTQFSPWLSNLRKKMKLLLPFVYNELKNDEQRGLVLNEIYTLVRVNPILFAHLIHECYSTNMFVPLWSIVSKAYMTNPTLYNKKWTVEIKKAWEDYQHVTKDHVAYIGNQMLKRVQNMTGVLNLYFVREDQKKFYRELWLYVFERGTVELYEREEYRFIEWLNAVDHKTAQRLVSGFIHANAQYKLENISQAIFDKMQTYKLNAMYWDGADTYVKEAFHRWYLRKHIHDFFDDVANKGHERFQYWERFIPKMQDAFVLDDRKTILFYFEDVIIIEILGTGAVYVYDMDTFDQHFARMIDEYREELIENDGRIVWMKHLKREMIMDKALVYKDGWLTHIGDWQHKFDAYLRHSLGWEI